MKPSLQNIKAEQRKVNFASFLLSEFKDKSFSKSEMKKRYNEAATNAVKGASKQQLQNAIKAAARDRLGDFAEGLFGEGFSIQFDEEENTVKPKGYSSLSFKYAELAKHICSRFNCPLTLINPDNPSEKLPFIYKRKEPFIFTRKKYSGTRTPPSGYRYEYTSYAETIKDPETFFDNGVFTVEEVECNAFRYIYWIDEEKAKAFICETQEKINQMRIERALRIVDEMNEGDKPFVFNILSKRFE